MPDGYFDRFGQNRSPAVRPAGPSQFISMYDINSVKRRGPDMTQSNDAAVVSMAVDHAARIEAAAVAIQAATLEADADRRALNGLRLRTLQKQHADLTAAVGAGKLTADAVCDRVGYMARVAAFMGNTMAGIANDTAMGPSADDGGVPTLSFSYSRLAGGRPA